MTLKFLHGLLVLVFFSCSTSDNQKHESKKYLGIYIDNEPRTGTFFKDSKGVMYNYRNLITTITNDSLIPINLKITFSKENYYPIPANGQRFRVFLLPENILHKQYFSGGVSEKLKAFLELNLDKPSTLSKVINPMEKFTFSIGVLTDTNYCDPSQLALISLGPRPKFYMHDSLINAINLKNKPFTLSLALDFHRLSTTYSQSGFSVIPCGQFTYSK